MEQEKKLRNELVKKLFNEDKIPEAEIGRMFNISRQRVHAIVRGYSSYKPSNKVVENSAIDNTFGGDKM